MARIYASLLERVLSKVLKPDEQNENGCWLFTGNTCHKGYGSITVRVPGKKSPTRKRAHIVVWEAIVGPLEEGLTLDHLCMVKSCCNPDHVEPVTRVVNSQRIRAHERKQRS